jgi:broad specificity phosphatase PhoE
VLARSPGTTTGRRGGVPAPDEPAWREAPGPLEHLPAGELVTSPAARARRPGAAVEPRLAPWDLGRWTGRALDELPPGELAAWRSDPAWAGHGGESLQDLLSRVASLLRDWSGDTGRRVAVTHASVVRAAVVSVLGAPAAAAWDLDVRPSSRTELRHRAGRWTVLSVGCGP